MGRHLELNNCIMTSAEAALPTLPNIASKALYVASFQFTVISCDQRMAVNIKTRTNPNAVRFLGVNKHI